MKNHRLLFVALFFGAFTSQSIQSQTLYNGVGHIPVAYQERWNRAGLLQDISSFQPNLGINVASMTEYLNCLNYPPFPSPLCTFLRCRKSTVRCPKYLVEKIWGMNRLKPLS